MFRFSIWLKQMATPVLRMQKAVLALGSAMAEKRRRVRESLWARGNELQSLLATSVDAIVVTDGDHRVVAANPKALDLLGVSDAHIKEFAIDAFLSEPQVAVFDGSAWPFVRRKERHGTCEIRRLDGSTRHTEFVFVANFLPLRNLCRFRGLARRSPI